jgi:hypothetical protein
MAVQARFYVSELAYQAHDPQAARLKLSAVVRGPENASWAAATPSGSIEMYVNNPKAVEWFRERQLAKEEISLVFDVAPEVEDRKYQ